ncbi:MAG: CmpA/NrtA family ABC transporter substrate-binding protein [Nevskia sp.]|uniref:CmpA/NrtA family ABC transporter substrate-binding protein n=1 Tax=Nevskia sp. TaxID=1929292 RepID=UPI004037275F
MSRPRLKLGLLPLADAAPLYVARECGFFAGQGLDVRLSVETTWASLRDKLAAGLLDAAQLLAPMPLAAHLGVDRLGAPIDTALTLSRNGNALTVSTALFGQLDQPPPLPAAAGAALKRLLAADRAAGRPKRVFAHVFPFSSHHYLLRTWLLSAGIDPDRDVVLAVVPPPRMLDALRAGEIDGYCAGAPWGSAAEAAGAGQRLLATHLIRPGCAEKVLAVTRHWAASHREQHLALVAALIEAGRWLEQPGHRLDASQMLVDARLIDVPAHCVREALRDDADDPRAAQIVFGTSAGASPHHDDARWFLAQMQRCGQVPAAVEVENTVVSSYRLGLHRAAALRATSVRHPVLQ